MDVAALSAVSTCRTGGAAGPMEGGLAEAVGCIRSQMPVQPEVALVLGSGLGRLAGSVEVEGGLSYGEIPGFPVATALGHTGRLTFGRLAGENVLLLEGRTHLYEGGTTESVTLPVRVLERLGVRTLIVTNAAGGLNPAFQVGDVIVLEDGLDLTFARGRGGRSGFGAWRVPGERRVFDPELMSAALEAARRARVPAYPGVYAAVTGPNYETRAEQRMYRRLGADVIGMSTMPEVLVAARLGLRVLGLSTVTNCCRPDAPEPTDGASVVHAAGNAAERVQAIVQRVIRRRGPR